MGSLRVAVTLPKVSEYELKGSYRNYIRWVEGAGVEAVPFFADIEPQFKGIRGILLSGGGDVDPSLYNEENRASRLVSKERDSFELRILERAIKEDMPILAICRGQQLLNVYFGGSLIQDLEEDLGVKGHSKRGEKGDTTHDVIVAPRTTLSLILGQGLQVNSSHHQAVKEPGEGLYVAARAPDGTIEALEHRENKKIIALQWHPERWNHASSQKILRHFISILGRS